MEDTDYLVQKEDFKDPTILTKLSEYADRLLPDIQNLFRVLDQGQTVKKSVIQKAMDPLQDIALEHLGKDGQPDSNEIAELEKLLFELGIQL